MNSLNINQVLLYATHPKVLRIVFVTIVEIVIGTGTRQSQYKVLQYTESCKPLRPSLVILPSISIINYLVECHHTTTSCWYTW